MFCDYSGKDAPEGSTTPNTLLTITSSSFNQIIRRPTYYNAILLTSYPFTMSTQGLDALAALCGNAASAAAANKNNSNSNDGDKAQGSGGEISTAPAPRSTGPVPSLNSGLPAFYQQQQGQQQQQFQQQYIHQQAAGLQQAAAARQAISSMPPQLLQAYLSSQPGIGQALQAALAGGAVGGGQFAAPSLAAAFPGLAASTDQQHQHQSQLQMIAAQVLAAQHQAAAAAAAAAENNGQVKANPQPQPAGECFLPCNLCDVDTCCAQKIRR
jgi:hypothetical protein